MICQNVKLTFLIKKLVDVKTKQIDNEISYKTELEKRNELKQKNAEKYLNNEIATSTKTQNENKIFGKKDEFIYSNYEKDSFTGKADLLRKCSHKEILDREEQKNINIFEIDPELSYFDPTMKRYILKIKPEYAIKAYTRSAADVKMDNPENLRPPSVLFETVKYLIENIIDIDKSPKKQKNYFKYDNTSYTFKDICLFAEDRFRAIRQDFIILDSKSSLECIQSHEIIARFLILSLNECLDYPAFSGIQNLFKLLVQQVNATLTSLREFYSYAEKNIKSEETLKILTKNKSEFLSYSILLSIQHKFDLVSMMKIITDDIKESPFIKHTLKIVRAILSGESISFFKLLKKNNFENFEEEKFKHFDYLITCVSSLYLKDMRKIGIDYIATRSENKVYNYKNNIKYILDLFAFENFKEFFDFLNWYGIKFPQEIRSYLKNLKKEKEKSENIFDEEGDDISKDNDELSDNMYSKPNFGNFDDPIYEEIKFIFNCYDNNEKLKENLNGSEFFEMEFFIETPIKEESELFRVTNNRFIERKKENFLRKEILIQG